MSKIQERQIEMPINFYWVVGENFRNGNILIESKTNGRLNMEKENSRQRNSKFKGTDAGFFWGSRVKYRDSKCGECLVGGQEQH